MEVFEISENSIMSCFKNSKAVKVIYYIVSEYPFLYGALIKINELKIYFLLKICYL